MSPGRRRQLALAAAIVQARNTAGYSNADLAYRLEVPIDTLDRWMRGDEQPDLEAIHRLEGVCSLRPGTILEAAGYVVSESASRVTLIPPPSH